MAEPTHTQPPTVVSPTNLSGAITLDSSITYQTIAGWEAVAGIGQTESSEWAQLAPKYRDLVADLALEVGINRVRLEITSGSEKPTDRYTPFITGQQPRTYWGSQRYQIINDNNDPFSTNLNGFQFAQLDHKIESAVLPLKARLEARGEKLYVNLLYVDFGESSFEHRDHPEEYGEFMLVMFQHMEAKYGFVPDAIEVILEPNNKRDDPLGWPAETVGPALVAAGNRLKAAGYTPDFIVPSTSQIKQATKYFDIIIQTPGALSYITELSYHRYGSGSLEDIASRSEQYNIGASMLEWWAKKNTYETLHEDLKVGRNSAWQAKLLATPRNFPKLDDNQNVASVDISDPDNPKAILTNSIKYFRQYFKFIRSGAQRIEAISTNQDFDPLAFINSDGRFVVVVKTSSAGSFSINGLPAGTYGVKYTTGDGRTKPTEYDVNLPDVVVSSGQNVIASIPGKGIVTIYRK